MMCSRRALHFVFKVGNRDKTAKFYQDILGMKVLRHEEFEEGCKASCNGPYDGKWSKTMVGYGPEDSHFVVELTYNYGIKNYKLGNDFLGLTIQSRNAINNAKMYNWPLKEENNVKYVEAPGGYKFFLLDIPQPTDCDPVVKVSLACSNMQKSIDYWHGLLGMKIYKQNEKVVLLGYDDHQCKLELQNIDDQVNHEKAFGRIAFSCPVDQLQNIEEKIKEAGQSILTPLLSLDTPGKTTVHVIILADPDEHEICFVGDEAFRQLSQVDPKGNELLQSAIAADGSDDWFAKKGISKAEA